MQILPEWPGGIMESPLGHPHPLTTFEEIEFALACYQLVQRQRMSHNGLAFHYSELQKFNPLLPSLDGDSLALPPALPYTTP